MYINRAIIAGNLTRDPEIKSLPSGNKVCTFSVATNRTWKDQNGAKQEAVDYHNIVVYGAQADNSARYLKKGSGAFIEGRIQTRSWDGADGKKQYRTEIVADRVTFMNRPSDSGGQTASSSAHQSAPDAQSAPPAAEYDIIDFDGAPNPDDIPF